MIGMDAAVMFLAIVSHIIHSPEVQVLPVIFLKHRSHPDHHVTHHPYNIMLTRGEQGLPPPCTTQTQCSHSQASQCCQCPCQVRTPGSHGLVLMGPILEVALCGGGGLFLGAMMCLLVEVTSEAPAPA